MKKKSGRDQWLEARGRLVDAERAAGIAETVEANHRAAGFDPPPWKAEHEAAEYRRIVFSIPDPEKRKAVMSANRDCHNWMCVTKQEEIREDRATASGDGAKIRRDHLWGAVAAGLCAVAVGAYWFSTIGALAGAVVAILVGVHHIREGERLGARSAEAAREMISENEEFLGSISRDGPFSERELRTGEPDAG